MKELEALIVKIMSNMQRPLDTKKDYSINFIKVDGVFMIEGYYCVSNANIPMDNLAGRSHTVFILTLYDLAHWITQEKLNLNKNKS